VGQRGYVANLSAAGGRETAHSLHVTPRRQNSSKRGEKDRGRRMFLLPKCGGRKQIAERKLDAQWRKHTSNYLGGGKKAKRLGRDCNVLKDEVRIVSPRKLQNAEINAGHGFAGQKRMGSHTSDFQKRFREGGHPGDDLSGSTE